MRSRGTSTLALAALFCTGGVVALLAADSSLDAQLRSVLQANGFTGTIESTLTQRLGRPIDPVAAELGRLLFFDKGGAVHKDNMCAGCHAPMNGMGDSQSIAIGIQSNDIVGSSRTGPRNQRRTPTVVNTAFYPKLMWNGRFAAVSGNPFNNSMGFVFPPPEGTTAFPPNDPLIKHLLQAQAHMPPTELTEVAGYTGTCGKGWLPAEFCQFDDGKGSPLPAPVGGFFNDPIRNYLLATRFNNNPLYKSLFTAAFPQEMAANTYQITFSMFARAVAEFEFTLVFADAPIDQYARGDNNALSTSEKRGALLFFGDKAKCYQCHATAGNSNQMFSDFQNRTIGVPQLAPAFGAGSDNVEFDGAPFGAGSEDFGLEQVTGDPNDRYRFRTSPLRNLAVSPAFFHNGAYTKMEDALRFHLNPQQEARNYDPKKAGVDKDLQARLGPIEPALQRLDPILAAPIDLTGEEFNDLLHFIRDSLLDPRARNTCSTIPAAVPSGLSLPKFQGCSNGN